MDEKKIEKILKETELPEKIQSQHKYKLRRELLNSNHFSAKFRFSNFFTIERLIGGVIAIAFLVFIFNSGQNKTTSEDLLKLTNTYYAGYFGNQKMGEFSNKLKVFGKEKTPLEFSIKQQIDFNNNNYRVSAFDKNEKLKLDEYILNDKKVYRTAKPLIYYKQSKFNSNGLNADVKFTIQIDSMEFSDSLFVDLSDSSDMQIMIKKHISSSSFNDENFVVYQTYENNGEFSGKTKPVYFPVDRQVDLFQFFKTNPIEIAENLKNADSLKMLGVFHLKDFNIDCETIERIVPLTKYALETIMFQMEEIDTLVDKSRNRNVIVKYSDSVSSDLKNLLNKAGIDDKFGKSEEILIDPENGKICGIRFHITRNAEKVKISEILFEEQMLVTADNKNFRPDNNFVLLDTTPSKIIKPFNSN